MPEVFLDTFGGVSFVDFAVFRKRLDVFLNRFFLGEFDRIGVAFIEVYCLRNQVTHLVSLQAVAILEHLGLCLLASEGIADKAELKVEVLGHLGALRVGSSGEVKLDDLLDGVA